MSRTHSAPDAAVPRAARGVPSRAAAIALTAGLLMAGVLAYVVLRLHRTPSYGSETDLIGDLIPAARSLRSGKILAENFLFKGPGYPALLAAFGGVMGGDDWLAARVLNVMATAFGVWITFLIAARFLSVGAAWFTVLGLFASPAWLTAAVESGSDMPAFTIALASTWIVLTRRGRGAWLIAGALAGLAYLTRYNTVSLVPAALVAAFVKARHARDTVTERATSSPAWWIGCYAVGFGIVIGGWRLTGQILGAGALENRNYLNTAFEIYGQGMRWDVYWPAAAARFHSFIDVFRFDPARSAQALVHNAATHWWSDIRYVLPLALGIPAVLGMLIAWPRRPGALAIAAHFVFAYLVLTSVFYTPRFSLYLTPFYLMGAAALLFTPPSWLWGGARVPTPSRAPKSVRASRSRTRAAGSRSKPSAARVHPPPAGRPLSILRWAVAAVLLIMSGSVAANELRDLLNSAPYETRDAGETLKKVAPRGGRLMARKPHAAYFAGMEYIPMPDVETFTDLMAFATKTQTDYLVFTALEAQMRQQFMLLADSGLALPGLEQIALRKYPSGRFYVLYRFTHKPFEPDVFVRALLDRAADYGRRNETNPVAQRCVARLLYDYGLSAAAWPFLERSEQLDPSDAETACLMAQCAFVLGRDAEAGEAADRAISLTTVTATIHAIAGVARASAGRWPDAQSVFLQASTLEPLEPRPQVQLALASFVAGDPQTAQRALDRSVELAPELTRFRAWALRTFGAGGDPKLALELIRRLMNSWIYRSDLSGLGREFGA